MKHVEIFRWWMPPSPWRKQVHLSRWRMDAEEAKARGALRPEPTTRMVIERPETEAERRSLRRHLELGPSTMARPWWMQPEMIALPVVGMPVPARVDLLALPVRQVRWLDDYWWPGRVR